MKPWNNWYHCTGTTYGAWLPGDPRGWRTRHHRRHVDGDYDTPPPPGLGHGLQIAAHAQTRGAIVVLNPVQRLEACKSMAEALEHYLSEIIELGVASTHFHLLARFVPLEDRGRERVIGLTGFRAEHDRSDGLDPLPRYVLGKALTWSSREVKGNCGLKVPRGIWAARPDITPVRDRQHQLNVVRYIREHKARGAVLLSEVRMSAR